MTIRFLLAEENTRAVRFAVSPLLEAGLSLNALLFPRQRPVQHPWIRAMRDLPAPLRREIRSFGFVFDYAIPDCLLPSPQRTVLVEWDAAVQAVAALSPEQAAYEITRPAFHYVLHGLLPETALAQPGVQAQVIDRAAPYGPTSRALARLAFTRPTVFRDRFMTMLAAYWETAFRDTWEAVGPALVAVARRDARTVATHGVFAILDTRFTDTVVDRQRGWILRRSEHEHVVTPTRRRPLTFLPSAFVWPHVRVNCDAPWPLALIYPPSDVLAEARTEPPAPELVAALEVLADPTRLRILRSLAERPRPGEELAPLVGLTAGATSRHLGALYRAGLVTRRRDGYYVLYGLRPGRVAEVGSALRAYLGAGHAGVAEQR